MVQILISIIVFQFFLGLAFKIIVFIVTTSINSDLYNLA